MAADEADTSTVRSVVLCGAKDCRTASGYGALARELTGGSVECQLIDSRCLDVCKGPVVVVGFGEESPVVLEKVRGASSRRDVIELVAGGEVTDRLRSRRVTGKRKRRALARVRPR